MLGLLTAYTRVELPSKDSEKARNRDFSLLAQEVLEPAWRVGHLDICKFSFEVKLSSYLTNACPHEQAWI